MGDDVLSYWDAITDPNHAEDVDTWHFKTPTKTICSVSVLKQNHKIPNHLSWVKYRCFQNRSRSKLQEITGELQLI